MNQTNVPELIDPAAPETVLSRLAEELPAMSRQLRRAAQYVIDQPNDVGLSSIREIAQRAEVKPNTLVRMARAIGFDGYEEFRTPFREALRSGQASFPDRARWLQSIARGGRHGGLLSDMAAACIGNVEALFAGTSVEEVKAAADRIVAARVTYVLGVGVSNALARNFAYLARMALDSVVAVPRDGSLPIDDIAKAGADDVLLAMTFEPYRTEVVEAVRSAREQGAAVIVLTDRRSSPIARGAEHVFLLPTETPQFFTSTVAATALLEALMAFVIADATPEIIDKIGRFHQRRHALGVYWRDEDWERHGDPG